MYRLLILVLAAAPLVAAKCDPSSLPTSWTVLEATRILSWSFNGTNPSTSNQICAEMFGTNIKLTTHVDLGTTTKAVLGSSDYRDRAVTGCSTDTAVKVCRVACRDANLQKKITTAIRASRVTSQVADNIYQAMGQPAGWNVIAIEKDPIDRDSVINYSYFDSFSWCSVYMSVWPTGVDPYAIFVQATKVVA